MSVTSPVRLATGIGGLALTIALGVVVASSGTLKAVAASLRPTPSLPVLGHVPGFRLLDERGRPFTTESLLGHVSVVDFIFTRCTASCPRLTARMAQLQDGLASQGGNVRLVSFSVDPENDTPPVLAEYAAKAHADPARWTFLTGPIDDVQRAAVLGFKMSAAKIARGAHDYDVTHGDWFVLVDRAGEIRGYYPTGEPNEFQALLDDVTRLEREGR
jgi:protein SCO1/2